MAVVSVILRYCMRHPARLLFIALLVVLVIASRFLYSSVPEQQDIHKLNLMTGSLSHHLSNRKHRPVLPVKDVRVENSEFKQTSEQERGKKNKGNEEEEDSEKSMEDSYREEKAENDLSQRRIPDNERLHENVGKLPPFEEVQKEEESENEVTYRKIADSERSREDIGKLPPFKVAKSNEESENDLLNQQKIPKNERNPENAGDVFPPKVAKTNEEFSKKKISRGEVIQTREAQRDNLTVRKGRKKSIKHGSLHQENSILMVLAKVGQTSPLAKRFKQCIKSICAHSTINLTFHILTDKIGKLTSGNTFNEAAKACRIGLNVTYYDVSEVVKKVQPIIKDLQVIFTNGDPNSYYSDTLFFLSTAIHHVLPKSMARVISLDADLFFKADIKRLFSEFDTFKPNMVFGLAREQQPVYRHVLHMFRNQHPGTKVGEPPPDGLTGFNSGVVLVNLHNMRSSKLYNKLLHGSVVKEIAHKYSFQGHLGDQDFYSLINLDYPELFHILPCSWNRQLCTYWKDKGYAEVFDAYFSCPEPIHVYHGNCGTKMPNE